MNKVFQDDLLDNQFKEKGFHIIDNFITNKEVEDLRLFSKKNMVKSPLPFVSTNYSNDKTYRRAIFEFIENLLQPNCDKILSDYHGLTAALFVKKPKRKSEVGLHLDWQLVDEPSTIGINIWIPLVDTNKRNGSIGVIPGSHRENTVFRGPNYNMPQVFNLKKIQTDYFKAGGALIFDNRLVHCSQRNKSWKSRPALSFLMIPKEAQALHYYFDPETNQVRKYKVDKDFYIEDIRYINEQGKYQLSENLPSTFEDVTVESQQRFNDSLSFFEENFC